MREETFGPVLPVLPFRDDEEGIALANHSDFGLAASVWGGTAHAASVASRIQAGCVLVNDVLSAFAIAGAPHGGLKQSGIGRTHGRLGMQELVHPRYLDVDLAPRMKKLWWYPYEGSFAAMAGFAEFIHAPGFWQRLRGALRSVPLLLRRRH